jgi:hypothetical protein
VDAEPTRQHLEERIFNSSRKFTWQEQAEAMYFVQENKEKTWIAWKRFNSAGKLTKIGFEKFADYLEYCGIAFSSGYKRTRLVKRADCWAEIRDIEITLELADALYKLDLDFRIFRKLILARRMETREKVIYELLSEADISGAATALLSKQLDKHDALGAAARECLGRSED